MSARGLVVVLTIAACGDDGGGPCLVPVPVTDDERLGQDCRVLPFTFEAVSCVAGGASGEDARVTVRPDGIELRTWVEYVQDGADENDYVPRVVGDLIGTGRCEPRREWLRGRDLNGYEVLLTATGFEVVAGWGGLAEDRVIAPDGTVVTVVGLDYSLCGGQLQGVRLEPPRGAVTIRPMIATSWSLRLARAPDGIRVAAVTGISPVFNYTACQSPVFITLDADGAVIAAESPVAVPAF